MPQLHYCIQYIFSTRLLRTRLRDYFGNIWVKTEYILYRVPGFLVNLQIGSPPPQASESPPHLGPGGGDTLACGGGRWGANSDEGPGTLVLYVNYNPSTPRTKIH
jgi:hypothetical protein